MSNPLLARVLPAELADRNQVIDFKENIGDFERVAEVVETDLAAAAATDQPGNWRKTMVSGRLAFSWLDHERKLPVVRGRLETRLPAVCQRCLEVFRLPLDTVISVLFTSSAVDEEQDGYDTWLLDEDGVRLQDVVEETLIMALPLAPAHAVQSDCGPLARKIAADQPEKAKPFADLRAQMDRANK